MNMKSLLASARSVRELDRVDRDVQLLEEQWQRHGEVSLERFWQDLRDQGGSGRSEGHLVHLGALVKADLRCRFERGQSPEVARYLALFPELRQTDSRVISLIYEEFCLREERGESPRVEAFCDRYAEWKDSLASQLRYHRLFSQAVGLRAPNPEFPEPDEQFEEFKLEEMIGRGGSSRVFLARDLSLGGKRVVLKVSLDRGQEPKTQGALDHPHIVPINSVAFQPDQGLRGLSMPYRPGLPLDEIVKRVRPAGRPSSSLVLWEVLFADPSPAPPADRSETGPSLRRHGPSGDGWKGFPRKGTYPQGVAWIAIVLARTLHYAHEMRTFHRDVKPANVLLTLQHGPQLLDFNLAESPHSAHHAESAMLGGTVPYMAPEQIEAFLNPDLWGKVGSRADLYSLGLVIRELLTGQAPDMPDEKLPLARAMRDLLDQRARLVLDLRRFNPEIPHALQAIVQRCLSFDPADRYSDAQLLAQDLERFLDRRPLQFAANPSRRERLGNAMVRHRRAAAVSAITILAGAVMGFLAQPAVKRWQRPPLEKTPAFIEAAAAVERGEAAKAVGPLRTLAADYSEHPLLWAYLGIAQAVSTDLGENEGQVSLSKAFGIPGAKPILRKWLRERPALAGRMAAYVWAQLADLKQKMDPNNPAHRDIQRKYFETITQAIELGLEAEPDSQELRQQMAIAKEHAGSFEPAHRLLTELIELSPASGDRGDRSRLIDLKTQRTRVSIHWAMEHSGGEHPAEDERAFNSLRESTAALTDLEAEVHKLAVRAGITEYEAKIVYNYFWISTEAWLAQGKLETLRRRSDDARSHFRLAKQSFDLLDGFSIRHPFVISGDLDELRTRVRAAVAIRLSRAE
jgi:serine/threonine protein kinase